MAKRQLKLALSAQLTFLSLALPLIAAAPLTAKTEKGKVQGTATADGKVIAFRGIPFAAPPVGKLRCAGGRRSLPQPGARRLMLKNSATAVCKAVEATTSSYPSLDTVWTEPDK